MCLKFLLSRLASWALFALFTLGGCQKSETHITPLQVSPFDRSEECMGRYGANTFVIEVLRYGGPIEPSKALASECRRCASGEVPCPVVTRRCVCARDRHDIFQLTEAIAGIRFDELSSKEPVCVRLVALFQPNGGGPSTGPGETCPASQCEVKEDDLRIQLCMLSDVGSLSEASTPLVLRHIYCSNIDAVVAGCDGLIKFCEARPDAGVCSSLSIFCSDAGIRPWADLTARQCATF
ncbi:MAG: hypothetical protein JRH20_18230 [Deltaproteobacteria bacterium]|nr:hypothetical protein [Deltaproteobacteria bacterium]